MRNSIQLVNNNETLRYKQSNRDSSSKKLFMCSTCNEIFGDISTLKRHKKNTHLKSPYPIRQKKDNRPIQVDDYAAFICSYCPLGFKRKRDEEKHEETHHSGSCPYTCDFCWCSFNNSDILKSHIFRFHNEIKNEINTDTFTSVTREVKKPIIIKRRTRFSNASKIQTSAVILSTPVIKLQRCIVDCNLLKKSSKPTTPAAKIPLKKRRKAGLGPNPKFRTPKGIDMVYADKLCCSYCPKFFASETHKLRHEKFHNGDWRFPCAFCPAMFYLKDVRDYHQKSCRKVSIDSHLWCNYCDFHTLREDNLKVHYARNHESKTSESNLPQPCDQSEEFLCSICDASFTSESMLNRHKWKTHQKMKKVKKSTVEKQFKKIISQNSIEEHTIFQREKKNNVIQASYDENSELFVQVNDSLGNEPDEIPVKIEQFESCSDQQITSERDPPSFSFCEIVYDPQFEVNFPKIGPKVKQECEDEIGSIEQERVDDPLREETDIENINMIEDKDEACQLDFIMTDG